MAGICQGSRGAIGSIRDRKVGLLQVREDVAAVGAGRAELGPVAAEQGGAEAREKRQREPHRAAEPAEPSLPRLSKVGSI